MILDKNIIDRLVDDNQVMINYHADYPDIKLITYTPKTQYKKLWSEYTLMCRGLVIDSEYNIISRPLKKFFNDFELNDNEIPKNVEFDVFEKLDGYCVNLFYYNGEWMLSSKDTFISNELIAAKNLIQKNKLKYLNKEYTYIFEMIHPKYRNVINYGKRKELVLIAATHNDSGVELLYEDLKSNYKNQFTIVNIYKFKSIDDINKYDINNNIEGYVVRYLNGFRIKIKLNNYFKYHNLMCDLSNISVWRNLKNNIDFNEIKNQITEDKFNKIRKTIENLYYEYNKLEHKILKIYVMIYNYQNKKDRDAFAKEVMKGKYSNILFSIYNGEIYSDLIWDEIKPKYIKII